MNIQKTIKVLGFMPPVSCPDTELTELAYEIIHRREICWDDRCFVVLSMIYNLGKMHGVQQERARRTARRR